MGRLKKGEVPKGRDPYKRILRGRRHSLTRVLRQYGMTRAEYDAMERAQGGLCAICYGPPLGKTRLSIDHDHQRNMVRALLCDLCNRAIGFLKDDAERAMKISAYLRKHDARPLEISSRRLESSRVFAAQMQISESA